MRKLCLSITFLWLLAAVFPALAQDDRPVAYIGGKPFTIEDMETRIAALPAQYQAMLTSDEGRRGFLDQVIQEQVLY
ncbi:MAG TPA: hypothetical protein ENN88_04460, partial [Candidatus Coatesbacteria bacterium]|nr:hypothetical protein [Candidatus Coatesbacteria bacterium]